MMIMSRVYKTTPAKRTARSLYYYKNREQILEINKTPIVKQQRKLVRDSWGKRNPEKQRRAIFKCYLKRTYNLTLEQHEELLKKQNNLCAICQKPEFIVDKRSGKIKKLAVDHNHKTGQVRGMLCINCNKGIGHFYENPKTLKQAIKYLQQWFHDEEENGEDI